MTTDIDPSTGTSEIDDRWVAVSDLGPPDGHETPWGSPYGSDAVAVLAALLVCWLTLALVLEVVV